ncbi:DNA recombination protein RmuC [Propylenella binzhouense]|uniref:DNA recombination protein RmuC homolog n=1 Tax=Propylenella binzhouense TaxID=2555902 RepID=A0A964T730_9HYPH|nr:DNA recombination protein RmuC [Propylenella binzhouense]MYZ49034.1 DNA recombination protein RmuC [Propylenella binzhouense]
METTLWPALRELTRANLPALAAGAVLLFLVLSALFLARASGRRRRAEAAAASQADALEARLNAVLSTQAELTGRMQTMAEIFGARQADLNRALSERLDGMAHKLNLSVGEASRTTNDQLTQLQERIAVIDAARQHIGELTGQVATLSGILGNKQARGAFGQGRMEAIIADALPASGYALQPTLKSGMRPDCLVFMPNGAPPLVIDAKFPLEAFNALRAAETAEATRAAEARLRADVMRHLRDIRDRYLVPGETHDTALMFVPSESIFAEIQERFEDVVQRAHRARIVIVSPSLLLLSIQVIQAVLRDARLKEQAHVIQSEVMKLMEDVGRLDERVRKLQAHFLQTQRDVEQVLVSSDKIVARGRRIEAIGEGEEGAAPLAVSAAE